MGRWGRSFPAMQRRPAKRDPLFLARPLQSRSRHNSVIESAGLVVALKWRRVLRYMTDTKGFTGRAAGTSPAPAERRMLSDFWRGGVRRQNVVKHKVIQNFWRLKVVAFDDIVNRRPIRRG